MKTKAAVLYKTGEPLIIEEIEIPKLQRGHILVKVFYSGVCHSQLKEARGERGEDRYLPHLLGHEATGEVIDIGKGVSKVKIGDKVVLTWIKGKGINAGGSKFKKGDIIINAGQVTTFCEYSVISENRCVKLPGNVPLDIGSLFGCAVLTGAGIVTNTIKPKEDSTVAVFGLGGIGLSALIAVNLYKCSTVIAIDIENNKLKLAKEFGATHIINSSSHDPVREILRITKNKGVDYAIESAGLVRTIEQAFKSVRKNGGLCVFASHPTFSDKIRIDPFDLICGKNIQGSWGGDAKPDRDIPRFAQFYLEGKLPLEKLISHRYKLDQINQALSDIENRKVTRGLLEIST